MKNIILPVLNNHNFAELPIGKIELMKDFNWEKINWDKYCFGAGYKPLEVNDKGEVIKSELLEISLIKYPENKIDGAVSKEKK